MKQQSLVWGLLISLGLSIALDLSVGGFVLGLLYLDDVFIAHAASVIALASLYFLWGLHEIPIGWLGAMKILGRRLRQSGTGLKEGWQWVPRPLMSIQNVDARDKKMALDDSEGVYSSDGALIGLKGFLRYKICDPYRYIAIDEVEDSLRGLGLQAMRIQAKKITAIQLRQADKSIFSTNVENELDRQLDARGNPRAINWGIDPGMVVIEDIWAVSPELDKAWTAKSKEEAEGVAEAIQNARRMEQVQKYLDKGVSPDIAVVAAQTDVEKPGAKITAVSLGRGIESALTSAIELLRRK